MSTQDFHVGEFVQRIARPESAVYRIDRVNYSEAVDLWFYDVTVVTGQFTDTFFPNTTISPSEYRVVTDLATWPAMTPQQREIFEAATLLLDKINKGIDQYAVHWLVETLRIYLGKLTDTGNIASPIYARRTAYVGNWPTTDSKESRTQADIEAGR